MKTCTKCHVPKLLDEFHVYRRNADGRQSACRMCRKAIDAERYANDTLGRRSKTLAREPDRLQEHRQYYQDHRDAVLVRTGAYQKTPKGRAVTKKSGTRYYATHQDKVKAYSKAYAQEHPEAIRAYAKTRRARKAGAAMNDFTAAQWAEMQIAYDHRCAYCGKLAKGHLTRDHIIPLSQRGNHTFANIVPACSECNSKKRTGPPPSQVQPLLLTIAPAKPYKPRKC